jgi:DhnA family fructose-bisphosphate aldolase class Ia
MLAFDHGYFQGPTTGLERIDLSIAPLFGETDVLMCTRGYSAQPGAGGHQQAGGAARVRR